MHLTGVVLQRWLCCGLSQLHPLERYWGRKSSPLERYWAESLLLVVVACCCCLLLLLVKVYKTEWCGESGVAFGQMRPMPTVAEHTPPTEKKDSKILPFMVGTRTIGHTPGIWGCVWRGRLGCTAVGAGWYPVCWHLGRVVHLVCLAGGGAGCPPQAVGVVTTISGQAAYGAL